jgi:hypothetical protein
MAFRFLSALFRGQLVSTFARAFRGNYSLVIQSLTMAPLSLESAPHPRKQLSELRI